jgi:DNA segregation ATPase FtsK/SpoIIIE, S-DNA-T family
MTTTTQADSGATTAPESQPTVTLQELRQEGMRLARRWRLQAVPLVAMAATHAAGAAAAALDGPEALLPIVGGWGGAAGAYRYVHVRTGRWGRVYAGIAAVGSAMFQAGIGVAGGQSLAAALMWGAGCAISLPWWLKHSEKDPDVAAEFTAPVAPLELPAVEPAEQAEDSIEKEAAQPVIDQRVSLWETHLGATGKRLAGSKLEDVKPFDYGWTGTVELQTEDHWHQILGVVKTIASVYDLPDGRVYPEPTGTSVRRAKLTVIERDPLEQVRRWDGPGLDERGSFPLMTPADGGEMLRYQLWNPGEGASHGLISGGTRSGKSKILDVALTECGMSPIIRPMIIDGGGGGSLPQWLGRVEEYASTLKDAKELVRYLLDLASKRRPALIDQGGGSIEPSEDHPLVALWIDEAHEFLMADKEFVRLCERYAQQLAKYAFGLHLATQVPSIEQLGGSGALRGQLKTGTIVALRITEGSNQSMISVGHPLPEKLKDLPAEFPNGKKTRGLGYVMTAERKIRSRALLLENPKDWEIVDVPLEAALRSVPAPTMTPPGAEQVLSTADAVDKQTSGTASVDDVVAHALADGCEKSPVAIMQATGLSLGQAREALKRF